MWKEVGRQRLQSKVIFGSKIDWDIDEPHLTPPLPPLRDLAVVLKQNRPNFVPTLLFGTTL